MLLWGTWWSHEPFKTLVCCNFFVALDSVCSLISGDLREIWSLIKGRLFMHISHPCPVTASVVFRFERVMSFSFTPFKLIEFDINWQFAPNHGRLATLLHGLREQAQPLTLSLTLRQISWKPCSLLSEIWHGHVNIVIQIS